MVLDSPASEPGVVIEPLQQRQPLVIATAVAPEVFPVVEGSCALRSPARLPADCRAVPVLRSSATATDSRSSVGNAFDGSTCTSWNAGGFAPQSITFDLGAPTAIDAIVLVPEMTRNGQVRHRIEFSDDGRTFVSAHRIEANMASGVQIDLVMPTRERLRFVRIVSDFSPSAIGWREVALIQCSGAPR